MGVVEEPADWAAERAPWIVVDTDGRAFACRRCGARDPFVVPVVLTEWVAASQDFCQEHRRCRGEVEVQVQQSLL